MSDALWQLMVDSGVDVKDVLIFLPSRRAVRTVEKMIVDKSGGVAILPTLIALGEGVEDEPDVVGADGIISNVERIVVLTKLLAADASVGNYSTALTIAHDLVRMQDYLENEGVNPFDINWIDLVDEKYATHFQNKARILNILSEFMPMYANGRMTVTQARNAEIRNWINYLNKYKLVIVCGSTGSVPATADLMCAIANLPHGRIILSGKIDGREIDFELDTNPYNSEYKLLQRLGLNLSDVIPIDVGASNIDFMNYAFGNICEKIDLNTDLSNCNLIECSRESIEASVVAEIAVRSVAENKSVLVITPDAAGNQRIANALACRGIDADFSGGRSGTMTNVGRAILNMFDDWIDGASDVFEKIYVKYGYNLFDTIAYIVQENVVNFVPMFNPMDDENLSIWIAIKDMSDALQIAGIKLTLSDVRTFVFDAISGVSVRGKMNDEADVVVLGTIESRMQTADVVILTGLNDGMFPARGYENAWLPRGLATKIGLPSPDRKVALQSLDFMNLSCGKCVYWLRATQSGGVQMPESRFLSRIIVRNGRFNKDINVLNSVLTRDVLPLKSLDYSAPMPPPDWSDVYVTELELLIHNPFAFYVKHILKLRVLDDYWALPDARAFGNLVHSVIENAVDLNPDSLIAQMDARALDILGRDSVIFHFWHKRFVEIAPVVARELSVLSNSYSEIGGCVKIAGRNVRARADLVWDGGVLDIKTGAAPSKSQLIQGNMPQLPIEAYMLQQGGFHIHSTPVSKLPIMKFLQLKNNDVRIIEYNSDQTADMIRAALDKVTDLINMYSAGGAAYEYHETNDQKYRVYDDFARVQD